MIAQICSVESDMPRYFFHVKRGQVTFLDREGLECADLDEAAREGARRAWEIEAREALTDLRPSTGTIIVEDEYETVLHMPFGGLCNETASAPGLGAQ
jgi:Domain of unknown function (DUF6894)